MFRSIFPTVFMVLSAIFLYGNRLKADEPTQGASSNREDTSVAFERRQFTVSRYQGRILFDGSEALRPILENKSKELRLIEIFDGQQFASDRAFNQWAHKLKGTRTYTYDEVHRVSPDGSKLSQPLVFFDKDQRIDLDLKWHAWLNERQAEIEKANQIRIVQEQEARRYQQIADLQELQIQALSAQAQAAQRSADSLAVISGATSLWEVELVPAVSYSFCATCLPTFGGNYYGSQNASLSLLANGGGVISSFGGSLSHIGSTSIYVSAYGRTSQIASDYALNSRPGYRVGSVRKLAGY